MAHLQVFKIVTNFKKFSNIFIEKKSLKWTHIVQTYVGQGASASVDEWIKEAITSTLYADESKNSNNLILGYCLQCEKWIDGKESNVTAVPSPMPLIEMGMLKS